MLSNDDGKIGWVLGTALGLGNPGADPCDTVFPARLHLRDSTTVAYTVKIIEGAVGGHYPNKSK